MRFFFEVKGTENKKVIVCHGITDKGSVFSSKAVCSDKDEFSFDKGIAIAGIKAKKMQLERVMNNCIMRTALFEQKAARETREADKTAKKILLLEEELAKYD